MSLNYLNQQKKLTELESGGFQRRGIWNEKDPFINGISNDSKSIRTGYIFFAISGSQKHGAEFAVDAINRGAILIITDPEGNNILQKNKIVVPIMMVSNPRQKLAEYAARWTGIQPKTQIAVTGTNGKTSVCHFVYQIWQLCGYRLYAMILL